MDLQCGKSYLGMGFWNRESHPAFGTLLSTTQVSSPKDRDVSLATSRCCLYLHLAPFIHPETRQTEGIFGSWFRIGLLILLPWMPFGVYAPLGTEACKLGLQTRLLSIVNHKDIYFKASLCHLLAFIKDRCKFAHWWHGCACMFYRWRINSWLNCWYCRNAASSIFQGWSIFCIYGHQCWEHWFILIQNTKCQKYV